MLGGTSTDAGSTASVSEPGTGPYTHAPLSSSFTARVGGRSAVVASSPNTAVDHARVITRGRVRAEHPGEIGWLQLVGLAPRNGNVTGGLQLVELSI
jgi:hypothetical protein